MSYFLMEGRERIFSNSLRAPEELLTALVPIYTVQRKRRQFYVSSLHATQVKGKIVAHRNRSTLLLTRPDYELPKKDAYR